MRALPWCLLAAVGTALPVIASAGDRSEEFQACVQICSSSDCSSLSLPLRLTGWTCESNCQYLCTHTITDKRVFQGEPVLQYFGKWPFWRVGGMQEPASVAFSLLNLWAHLQGFRKVRGNVRKDHPMRSFYLAWAVVSVNAWTWSSVFHTRDLPSTEKLDYFSAALAIGYALYMVVIRTFHIYPTTRLRLAPSSTPKHERQIALHAWTLICCLVYLGHISYLTLLPRFDYTYNMTFNLILGIAHNLLWLSYSSPSSWSLFRRFPNQLKSYRPPYANKAALFVLLTTAATSLELFDFPPWGRIIDAHALWHLVTIPIAVFWYDFLIQDSSDVAWRDVKT